jgi:hypothetical protein
LYVTNKWFHLYLTSHRKCILRYDKRYRLKYYWRYLIQIV